eukprot:TRINITY_DN4256_c0_g1_i1.p1 TRINITY_DN4256_c0_g1~~TRINITY_DN4256_c0_g1_i1.p1  ORF type:complete len:114 (-),score=24.52 TRINITY_DN4256_c0_g1_i1:19-360(-)
MEYYPRRGYERDLLNYSPWPQTYHNSFWSNYYTHYWQPSSSYYNSFTLPSTLLPSYSSNHLESKPQEKDPYTYSSSSTVSESYKNIKSKSHSYFSKMMAKRYPFVSGPVAMFV